MRFSSVIAISMLLCICATQAAFYRVTIGFSRRGTSYNAYLDDRHDCLKAASQTKLFDIDGNPGSITSYNANAFRDCMIGRGYLPDDKGFKIRFRGSDSPHSDGSMILER